MVSISKLSLVLFFMYHDNLNQSVLRVFAVYEVFPKMKKIVIFSKLYNIYNYSASYFWSDKSNLSHYDLWIAF